MKCRNKHTLLLKYSIKVWIILLKILYAWAMVYVAHTKAFRSFGAVPLHFVVYSFSQFHFHFSFFFSFGFLIDIITFAYFLFYINMRSFFFPSYSFVCLNGKIIQIYGYVNVRWKQNDGVGKPSETPEFSILSTIFFEWTFALNAFTFRQHGWELDGRGYEWAMTRCEKESEHRVNGKGHLILFFLSSKLNRKRDSYFVNLDILWN